MYTDSSSHSIFINFSIMTIRVRASTLFKLVSFIFIAALALHYYKKYFTEEKEKSSEGFTQLLYSRIRPQTRNARLFYEEYYENSLKYIDRIRYNLGMR